MRILVTGATGYVGGRLAPRLAARGHQVACMTRNPARLAGVGWTRLPGVEIVQADALDPASLRTALAGVDAAYYLIHSVDTGGDFSAVDRRAAAAFAEAARAAGVRRIIYLGGLSPAVRHDADGGPGRAGGAGGGAGRGRGAGEDGEERLSAHLASRREVGRILLDSGVPTAALGASVIIGSGSTSFEMLRHLTERLPVMTTPRWVRTRTQPIAIRDVLHYLIGCLELPADVSRRFDIGGPEVLTYAEMMRRFAAVEGLRPRVIIPVPVLSPALSSLWVGLVTPVPKSIAKPLVRSLTTEAVASEHDIAAWVPDPPGGLLPFEAAVARALDRAREHPVPPAWSTAAFRPLGAGPPGRPAGRPQGPPQDRSAENQPSEDRSPEDRSPEDRSPEEQSAEEQPPQERPPSDPMPTDPPWAGGSLYTDERVTPVDATPERLWQVIEGLGGRHGWSSRPLAWSARGWLDGRLEARLGGLGLLRGRRAGRSSQQDGRSGRRDAVRPRTGEKIDCWRVERVDAGRLLRLRAEIPLPGRAWLELQVGTDPAGRTACGQRALFAPGGLAGHLCWRALRPLRAVVLGGMARDIGRRAGRDARAQA